MLLDGEEEAGSPNFDATMVRHASDVKSDLAIVVDSPRHPSGLPTVFYGSRGTATATVKVYGATGDLHSGNYGNFMTDPTMALARLLASMKDERGNVAIRNFYDDVVPLTATERKAIDDIPNIDGTLLEEFGLARPEHPDSRIEAPAQPADAQHHRHRVRRRIYRNAIRDSRLGLGAHRDAAGERPERGQAAGSPGCARPRAGIPRDRRRAGRCRETPVFVDRARHARRRGFPIGKTSMDDARTAIAVRAIRSLDQRVVQLPTIGGSLPFATFSDTLALPAIGLAVVNFDNNQHAVNENIRVGHLWEAIDIFAALLTMQR